jgi:hypothetical protein
MSFNANRIIISVDPGFTGGLTILEGSTAEVFDPPTIKTQVKKKNKKGENKLANVTKYDLQGMYNLLANYAGKNALFAIERVGPRPGEGSVSVFNFGEGYGYWKMAAVACGMELVIISPQTWKKSFPELTSGGEIDDIRASQKALKVEYKETRDKTENKRIKKEIDSLGRRLKTISKDRARVLAASLYPDLESKFRLKKHDGRAESLLIARHASENLRG